MAVKDEYDSKIVGLYPYEKLNPHLGIKKEEYIQWKSPFMFRGSFVIVHERKYLVLFWLLNYILLQKIKIIYIHHNMLYGHKMMTIIPQSVVCISDRGRENLIQEFGVNKKYIHKIYNCVEDRFKLPHKSFLQDKIKILYPARINNTKRQIEIVRCLKGRLSNKIQIIFAGDGPLLNDLKNEVSLDNSNFKCVGFASDMERLYNECDFVMLFSEHEGLPISLIEATMMGIPIICNDVGGNSEIATNGNNAIVVNEWENLISVLNDLPTMDNEKYLSMCRNSRKIYQDKFTFDLFKKNYLNLLNSMS